MPDPGQVPQQDPRIVAGRLEPMIAMLGGDRMHGDDQARLPRSPAAQPPDAIPARRPLLPGRGDREPRAVGVAKRAGWIVAAWGIVATGGIVAAGGIVATGGIVAAGGRAWCAAFGGT